MDYVDGNDLRTQREVEPLEVRRVKGELVRIAHCRLRNDRRNFKIERIIELTRIDRAPAPALSPAPAPSPAPVIATNRQVQLTLFPERPTPAEPCAAVVNDPLNEHPLA
jgi:predicted DNA-binding transcriptional regulator YafY